MNKVLELIEQIRFAELKKIDVLSKGSESYLRDCSNRSEPEEN
ncbi:hypothetical protein [Lutimonas saemankumensis]|nr:hypothetical protein [Lutimonas saemankumensis]